MIDIKSLLGNADGGGFTVDDILSEFGTPKDSGPDLPWPQAPKREPHGKNVVLFPGVPSQEVSHEIPAQEPEKSTISKRPPPPPPVVEEEVEEEIDDLDFSMF